uniref:Kunitz/Bovine pancreatic trypsin inhibitor domain protein n=1 Tax=Haemonchus contortus TaxID=6289 RepID=A0A7I4YVA0_HAECO
MRFLALLAACAVVASIEAVDPCKRQPFRGRCPSKNGESPKRSQFVLRYYMRNGECVSYPYGHCANDDSEPQLYRYKEECEDACINPPPANLGSPKSDIDQTYGTVGPVGNAVQPNEAAVTQTSAETTTQADNTSRSVSTQSPATTECERRRAAAAASTIRGGFVPACTAHGAFEKVQCEPDGRQCFCVDAKGIEIANSRTRNGQKPDCDGIQLSSAPKTKECVGGAARGPCSAALTRWYYDEQEAKCKRFTFSGCGGNGNNYDTEEACIRRCAPPPMGLPKCEKGEPLKTKLGVPVNCAKSDCPYGYKCSVVQQTSVCCPENNKIIGLQTSGSADVCSLPKERGPCDNYELRFYYNAELKECKYFFWGGCQGNKNNFEKVEDCEATCGIAKAKDSIPTTPAPSTQSQRLPFRTTQGIRITPGNFSKNEDGSIVESSTTVTSPPVAATAPGRVFTPEPKSAFESLVTSENIKSDPTIPATVHVAPTRAPPIPQMALLEGSEDNSANSVNRCLHPKDPGTCRGQFIRWYWDNDRKTCDVFTYTGCQGNGNNYASREECLAICHKEATPVVVHDFSNVCKHDVDAGECNGVFQRFAFDTESGECRPFTYGGCGGNGNNFATLAECRIKCQKVALSPGNLCEHDIEVGECSGVFVRFGYDKATNDCRQFTYGGCGGNGNNFATIQECRNVCIRKVCNPNPQCDLTRCQIVNDRNGCPFCSCPPTSQPSPPGALQCPEVNVDTCKEPCIIINNRKGCKDCVCPSLSGSIGQPPASFEDQDPSPIAPSTSRPVTPTVRTNHISARPPSAPTSVGPPSGPTPNRSSPPGTVTGHFSRRQESVPTVQSSQSKQVEIGSKQLLPPPLSAHLQEKCMQPVEPGPCKHFVDRWFFNGEDGTCHPFKYGGCAGNRNHFFSQNECEIHCARFLRIISDDDEEEEDFVEEIPRRAAGVAQVHTRDPIEFEHYHPPSPPSQGSSQPQAIHGKKIAKVPVIHMDGLMSTSSTEVSEENGNGEFHFLRTDRPPTITGQRVSRTTLRPVSTTEAPHSVSTTSRSSTVTASRTTGSTSTTKLSSPRTESTTTASADESQSSTGTAETSYGTTQGSTPITEQAPIKPEAPFSATEATTSETSDFSNASQNETTDATTVSIESTSESTEAFSSTPSSDSTPYYSSTNPLPTDDDGSLTTYLATTEKSTNVPSLTSTSPPYESTDGTTAADSDVSDSSEISSTPSVPVTTDSGVTDTNAATSNSPQISTTVSSHVESTSEETTIAPTFTDSSTPREDSTTTETTPSVVPSTEAVNLPHQSLAGSDNTIDHDSKTFDNDEHISEEEIEFFDPNNLPPPPPENERRPPMNVAPPHLYGEKVKALKKIEIRPQPIVTTSAPTFTATATDGTIPSTNDATTPAEPGDTPSGEALSPSSFEISSSEDMAGYSIGREPVPLSPTGIGRNMEKLDIDGLEEPTTIIPLATTTLPAATNTTATTSTHAAATSTQATSTPLATTGKQLSAEPSTTQTQTTLTSTVQTQTTGSPTTTTPASTTQPSTTQAASTQTSSTPPPPTTSTPTTQPPVTYAQTTPAPTSRPTPASSPVTTRATPQTTPQPTQPTTTRNVPRTAATVGVPTEREEIDARVLCALPPDAGPCFEYVPRWFFNAQSGQCEQFSYGSCGGNENNFADRSVCEIKCLRAHSTLLSHVPERCTYERDGGSGKGYNVKWYFNMKNLRCEQFVYEGRGGNQNQFETLSDCERYCSPQPGSPKYVIPPTTTTIRPPAPPVAPQTQPRPSAGQPVPDRQTIEDILDYDEKLSHFVEESVTSTNAPPNRPVSNTIDNRDNSLSVPAPQPPISNPVQSPGTQPRPPAAQAAKTVVHKEKTPERSTNVATGQERRKEIYKAEPLPSKPPTTGNENLPIVGPSPPMSVNYQTGEVKNRASGIRTFQQSASRVIVEDSDLTEGEEPRRDLLSCPNGLKELRYADGRPVMCLPGKNQCPEKSVCYFNGVDFFCCPNEEDPYDKHVFGGYDGEETKHGYKVFGPLNIRRLMDEVPLRARREARSARVRRQASSNGFTAPQSSFSIDSITAPLRFDEEKPRTVSRAQRMRSNPSPPHHGNPICIEPLATGDCGAAHLRYYYDRDSDKCRLFYYTGCKGNNNNFGSMIDCQRLCVLSGQRPRPESDESTPPPVLRGQCPDGKSPLGGSAPVLCGNTTDSIGCPTGFFCLHGPPDICCPNGEVKRKVEKGSVRFAPEVPGVPRAHSRNVLLSTPKYMCPDASDPLMASNGEPTNCGAGFDGMKLCPKGFYCAIDVEKQSRMCCPLYGAAERVPTEQGPAPYLGRRPSNPGEVLERGSLPSDQSEYISRTRKEQMQERRRQMLETTTSVFAEESEEFEDGEEEEDEEEGMAHLMLKPAENSQPKADPATSTALPESKDHHIIDLPTEPPTVEEAQPVKTAEDKSVCQIKPSEGRACREDEKPPRTNLHYFYSPKDRRCKLYFFRGCGGNANRFEKKADCERLCLS